MVRSADGDYDITYDHRPLYLYDEENIRLNRNDHLVANGSVGNGAEKRGPSGVMSVVPLAK